MSRFLLLLLFFPLSANAQPVIQVNEPIWNVGTILESERYEREVLVENIGDEPLIIEKIEDCCGFFGQLELPRTLPPGEGAKLLLIVKPYKMVGDFYGEIFLNSNDPGFPRFPIAAIGQVSPKKAALGELFETSRDLGIVSLHDRIPFKVQVRNVGSDLLQITGVEKSARVVVVGGGGKIEPGGTAELSFEYVPVEEGPVEDVIVISTNDALRRVLTFRLKGYVTADRVPSHSLVIFPVGKIVDYDNQRQNFQYHLNIDNRSNREIEILKIESSLPVEWVEFEKKVPAQGQGKGLVRFRTPLAETPVKGHLYLRIALPLELR